MNLKDAVLSAKSADDQIALFYTGQEGFLVKYRGTYLLFDGYLSDYVDRQHYTEEIPWKRRYPAPISGNELDFIDYVFCSHGHDDHMDPDTLSAIASVNDHAKFIVPAPLAGLAASFGIAPERILPARAGESISLDGITVLPVPAAHEELETDENGDFLAMGYRLQLGAISLYHAGDCCVYDGQAERLGQVDVALLPVNGRSFYKLQRGIIGNMDAAEAAELAVAIGAKLLVPMHYDLYAVNGLATSAVVEAIERIAPDLPFHLFRPGEKLLLGN